MNAQILDEQQFWKIIQLLDWDEQGDDDAVMAPALAALAEMDELDICEFDSLLCEKLHALDTRAHCRACYAGELDPDDGDDYISADDFLYARCVVVANGFEFYSKVLADPTQMPQDMEFEALLSLAAEAYEQKTGQSYDFVPAISCESFQNEEGWAASEETKPGEFTSNNVPPGNRRPT